MKKAFTLIELLVVIATIMILVGLLMPAFQRVMLDSERAKAKIEVKSIAAALDQFYLEYGRYPDDSVHCDPYALWFIEATLNGMTNVNPKGIVFLGIPNKSNKKVDATYHVTPFGSDYNWVDPWDKSYQITFDHYGQSHSEIPGGTHPGNFAVWSSGQDGKDLTVAGAYESGENRDNLTSW